MRQTFKLVLDKLHGFLNIVMNYPQIEDNSLTTMIEQAIHKDGCSCHTCRDRNTGIVKHDANRQQIIVKIFKRNSESFVSVMLNDFVFCSLNCTKAPEEPI